MVTPSKLRAVRLRHALLAAGSLGVAAGIVYSRRRAAARTTSGESTGDPAPALALMSRTERIRKVAQTGGKAGATFAVHKARRAFASTERQAELDAAFELQTAEQVAETLGHMKGALMKLGQMASYLDSGIAEPVRQALAGLQQDAPPMSSELAASVVERELGAPPEELFLDWDPVPMASASIGQVHRAITQDRQAVAVKVQYPGVDEAIRSDLANSALLGTIMGVMFPGLEPGPLVEEIRARVTEELDYALEARSQQTFADYYRGHPTIHVPDVVPALSTGRVLTTELAEGVRFDEMLTWTQEERDQAAETIYRFVFRSLYRLMAFNGDPHPGNYVFRPGGQVSFLDFGMVKYYRPDEVRLFEDMITAYVLDQDVREYRKIIERIGLLKPGLAFSDAEVEEYFGHFYSFVVEDAEMTITPEWSSQTMSRFFDPNGPYGEIAKSANLPPAFVIIQRINLGLMAILGDMHATANFRRIAEELWPWVDRGPTTELGKQEAIWLANKG